MTICNVIDKTTGEREEFYSLSSAKKWMRDHQKQGHKVSGTKTRVYSNGDWVPCGEISLTGSNKVFIANSMTKPNY